MAETLGKRPGENHKQVSTKKMRQGVELPSNAFSLSLSGLYFDGVATYSSGPEYLADYRATPHLDLQSAPTRWSTEHEAFIYTLPTPLTFTYQRSKFIGRLEDDTAFDESSEQAPMFFLHQTGKRPWTAYSCTHPMEENRTRMKTPPFPLYSVDSGYKDIVHSTTASGHTYLCVDEPDVQLHAERGDAKDDEERQAANGDESEIGDDWEEEEEDSSDDERGMAHHGWRGSWTYEFLRRDAAGEDLGSLTKISWAHASGPRWDSQDKLWGAKIHLTPVPKSSRSVKMAGKERLSYYEMKGAVVEVYVKAAFFEEQTDSPFYWRNWWRVCQKWNREHGLPIEDSESDDDEEDE